MQYCIINNDIALLMHYRALLQMPDTYYIFHIRGTEPGQPVFHMNG